MTETATDVVPAGQAAAQLERVASPLDDIARMGKWLWAAESGSTNAEAQMMSAALRMAYADRLGLPLHAAADVYLIKGNLTLSAKLKRALAHTHGVRVERVDVTDDSCTAVVYEGSRELGRATYTLAMAARQGLKGDNWTRNPDRMLWARASSRALDDFAPWVTVGLVTREDVEDFTEPEPDGAVLSGEVLEPDDVPFGDAD